MHRTARLRHRLVPALLAAAVTAAGLVAVQAPAAAEPLVDRLTFTPVEDTYVDSASPSTAFGSAQTLRGDASPQRRSFLRFAVEGLQGRTPTAVRLRLHAATTAISGGRVLAAPASGWSEATTTWADQPATGAVVATLPAPTAGADYEVPLSVSPAGDGGFALALDSLSSSEARWDSREALDPPVLVVEVPHVAGQVGDGTAAVTTPYSGSAEPTYLSSNDHLARTQGGRLLAVHGRHRTGVALAWRDPGSGWRNVTRGAATNGVVLSGSSTGDWPASVVLARTAAGEQVGYVVVGRNGSSGPLHVRRLTDLDAEQGPVLGPLTTLVVPTTAPTGARRVDAAVESTPSGDRLVVSWTHEEPAGTFRVRTGWVTDLTTETPSFATVDDRAPGTSGTFATVVEVPGGLALVQRRPDGRLAVARHAASAAPGGWGPEVVGASVPSISYPSAVALDDGTVAVSVTTSSSTPAVAVQRFPVSGPARALEGTVPGRRQPVVASDGRRLWLVSVRDSDGAVVSRSAAGDGTWETTDAVELAPVPGVVHTWPSVLRRVDDGRLRVLARGATGSASQGQVVFGQRPVAPPPPAAVQVVGATATQSGASQSATTSVTLTLPAGAQPGHVLLAHIGLRSKLEAPGLTAPAGWSLVEHPVESSGEAYLYRAVLGSTVSGTSWTWSGGAVTNKWTGTLVALSGAGATAVSASSVEPTTTATHTSPTVTAPAGSLLLAFAGDRRTDGSSWTWPDGWLERSDLTSTGTNAVSGAVATLPVGAAVPRSVVATASGASSQAWVSLIAVQPAA